MQPKMVSYILFMFLACAAQGALASKIVGIVDGDTLDAIIDGKQQRVRVAQIDAPERGQPYGKASKQALSDLAYGKDCTITPVGDEIDRYGRTIGQIVCDGKDVNLEMVRMGYAWAYRKYLKDPEYLRAEEEAKEQGIGLWKEPNPIPPWDWRKNGSH